MNPCREMEPLISALLDNELSASQRAVLSEHLGMCPQCRRLHADFRQLEAAWAEPGLAPSDSLAARVNAIPRRVRQRSVRRVAMASTAALALITLGTWLQWPRAAAEPISDPFGSLYVIHRVQESAQRSTLNTCEWDLRLLRLQVDRMQVPPEQKSDLLARIQQLMHRVRMEKSMSPYLSPGA